MFLSRAPLTEQAPRVRLACIRHAASVRPEPGSNSSLCGFSELKGSVASHEFHIVGKVQTQGPANKKAGEYSEEDTHRPAHHYREVVARRTFGRLTGQSVTTTLEKETR